MTRLLCATDLLPKSEPATDRAGLLADELDAGLSLLHVVSPVASARAMEELLQVAVARMRSRVRAPLWRPATTPDVVVRAGNPPRVILDTIAREQPNLLIVGPHDRRSVGDALQGTIVEKIISARICPVLVVQKNARATYRNILLALDAAAESTVALRAAERLVLRDGARATVIHACASPDHAVLRTAGSEADSERYELVVSKGNPLRTIMRAIGRCQPDLLVMGTRGDRRMRRAVLGSVANQLLKAVPCDMLIVPRDTSVASNREDSALCSAHHMSLGSVTRLVLERATCDVVVVPQH